MHENRVNGKKYIGITKQIPEKRWQNGYGYRESPRFFNAIQLYGWDAFKHEVLFFGLTGEEAALLEIQLIEKYKTLDPEYGYNLDPGGGGISPKTPEVRKKMSESRKGWKPTPDTIERLRISHRGKKASPETRKKMSEAHKGVKKSAEHAKKIGASHSKRVQMLSEDGELLAEFTSMTAAAEATGVRMKNISAVCCGERRRAGGYRWRYALKEEKHGII